MDFFSSATQTVNSKLEDRKEAESGRERELVCSYTLVPITSPFSLFKPAGNLQNALLRLTSKTAINHKREVSNCASVIVPELRTIGRHTYISFYIL